jgi:hypothetical protein
MLHVNQLIGFGAKRGGAVAPTDPSFSSVVLLMGFEGADASTTFDDESTANHTMTATGNAQIDTAQFKFGASSLLLDGSGDAVETGDSADWDLSGANSDQFTVEAWIRFNSTSGTQVIVSQFGRVNQRAFSFRFNNGTGIGWFQSISGTASDVILETAWSPSTGTWYHVACDKSSGGVIRTYVDGVMFGKTTPADSTMFNATENLRIGASEDVITGTLTNFFNGWIDEIRITKGVARYASDSGYTVPTAAFPRS